MVFFDFQKAFDMVNRRKLITKLEQRGLDHNMIRAIEMILANTTGILQGE